MNVLDRLNSKQIHIINLIRKVCEYENIEVYLVGGAVRDIFMGRQVNDIDICLNENPMTIIKLLDEIDIFKYYDKFQTASVNFKNEVKIDLIRCRSEFYSKPGMLPEIMPSDIFHDLYRRDFTINALAYNLKSNELIDLYGGISDIKHKSIRKIHYNSYQEDPTRIFRAVKYASRYGFYITDKFEIINCIDKGALTSISNDRITKEIYLISNERNWKQAFKMIGNLHIFSLNPKLIGKFNPILNYENLNMRILNLFYSLKFKEDMRYFTESSVANIEVKSTIEYFIKNGDKIEKFLEFPLNNSDIFYQLRTFNKYGLAYLSWNNKCVYKIYDYMKNLKECKLNINGNNIKKIGVDDGKLIGKILKYVLKIKLNTGIEKVLDEGEIENVFKYKDRKF